MNWSKEKIKGKTFSLFTPSKKFNLGKTKKTAGGQLTELGAKVVTYHGKAAYDHVIIGYETERFLSFSHNDQFIFEGELIDRSYQDGFTYFKDFDLKLYNMLRRLLSGDNIDVSYIYLGEGVSEDTFDKYEKKLKKEIPLAVKEFYSLFGEIRILWKYRNPYISTGVSSGRTSWNLDYHDNHIGSFQTLPLQTVLFENWNSPSLSFGVGDSLKLFDSSSNYYPIAFDITGDANPLVYRGEDHGVQFDEASPFLFTDYLNLSVNLYGKRDRFDYFSLMGLGNNRNKSTEEKQAALAGSIDEDINNDKFVQPLVDKITKTIDNCFANQNYKGAQDNILELHNLKYRLFRSYFMELNRLEGKTDDFLQRLETAATKEDLDWQAYVAKHSDDPVFQTKAYEKLKKKLLKFSGKS